MKDDFDPSANLDAGAVVGSIKRLEKILVGQAAKPASAPVWLDNDGKAFRTVAGEVRQAKPDEVIIHECDLYEELPFSRLLLK